MRWLDGADAEGGRGGGAGGAAGAAELEFRSLFVGFMYYKFSHADAVLCDHNNVSCIFPETSFSHKEETANIQSLQALVALNPTQPFFTIV